MNPTFTINRKPIGLQFEVTGSPDNISILLDRLDGEGGDLEYQILRDLTPEPGKRKLVFRVADLVAYDLLRDMITETASLVTDSPRGESPINHYINSLQASLKLAGELDYTKMAPKVRATINRGTQAIVETLDILQG